MSIKKKKRKKEGPFPILEKLQDHLGGGVLRGRATARSLPHQILLSSLPIVQTSCCRPPLNTHCSPSTFTGVWR